MGKQPPAGGSDAAIDLFDRWMAHREQTAPPAATDEDDPAASAPGPTSPEPVAAEPELLPEPVAAEPEPEPEPIEPAPAPEPEPTLWEPVAEEQLSFADLEDPDEIETENEVAPAPPATPAEEDPWALGSFDDDPMFAEQPPAADLEPEPEPEPEPDPEPYEPGNSVDAGRAIFAALTATPPAPTPAAEPAAVDTPVATRPVTSSKKARREPRTSTATPDLLKPVPHVVEFTPRTAARRIVGILVLIGLAATGVAGYLAWQERTFGTIGIVATLGLLTAVIWAVRAGSAVAVLTVRGGQLEVLRGGSRHRFDLASHYTPLEIISEPGKREWKVLFHRRGIAPFVIDSSMVDPAEFMRVLNHYRPVD